MPVYKDLYDMIRQIIREEEEKINREIERVEEEIKEFFEEPLYTSYEERDTIYYIIDVPFINEKTIYIKVEGKKIKLSCTDIRGKKYQLTIPTKYDIENYNINVIRDKGFIKLVLKKKKST